jgi:amidase
MLGYSAGGSSSGTANLVAKGEVDLGIGADQVRDLTLLLSLDTLSFLAIRSCIL